MRIFQFTTFTAALAVALVALPAQETETEAKVKQPTELKPLPEYRRVGFDAIDPELCKKWLTYLASDELRGRATGEPGYKLAAEYVAARFAEAGLKPVGDKGTYFQNLPYFGVGPDSEKSYVALMTAEGKELLRIRPGKGLGGRISENSDKEFVLVALEAKTAEDVEAAELEGNAVLFVDKSERQSGRGRRGRGTAASAALRSAGAGAIVTIDDAAAKEVEKRFSSGAGRRSLIQSGRSRRANSYAVSSAVATQIRAALAANPGLKFKTHIEISREPAFAANVVGLLEGRDPELKHEIVGIGSHLDHIGVRGGVINNGADDDGSGTTGVLALARAFAKNPTKPRRSVLFMCFAGEETGMVGSGYYAANPIFKNEQMVVELQMDMIGRNEEKIDRRSGEVTEKAEDNLNTLHLIGSQKLSNAVHEICLAMNEAHIGFDFEFDEEGVFYRSDHVKFAQKDIPIAFFFTGFHPQYHQPDDTVDKINFPKLVRVARLVYSIAFEIGDADERPKRDRLWKDISPPNRGRRR